MAPIPVQSPIVSPVQNTKVNPKNNLLQTIKTLPPLTLAVVAIAIFVFLAFVLMLVSFLLGANKNPNSNNQNQTQVDKVAQEKEKQLEASRAAALKQIPINQLQQAYIDVVGSDSSKRTLTLDEAGVATIEYEISSTDGQVILKTSFENFADLAVRVFNIPTITRLNVTTYANRFTDKFGKPNVFAVKLQITKDTNSKINWPIKKFAYADYASILDLQEINSDLQKDYIALTKKK